MEINIKTIVLFLSIFTSGLSAGLFYGWVVSVIPGLKKIPDQAYIESMQTINRAILNPGFFIVFIGTVFFLLASTYLQFNIKINTTFYLIFSATLIYIIGTIGVTMFGNVPLNNIIEMMDLSTFGQEDFQNARAMYEDKWNNLNMVRTIAALISFALLIIASIK